MPALAKSWRPIANPRLVVPIGLNFAEKKTEGLKSSGYIPTLDSGVVFIQNLL